MTQQTEIERYRAMALEARTVADRMKDPEAQNAMRQIADGYEQLARAARKNSETTGRIRSLIGDDPKLA